LLLRHGLGYSLRPPMATQPLAADLEPLSLTCPLCGRTLYPRQEDDSSFVYLCERDGLFWIDGAGFLRARGRVLRMPAFDRH
jgi:hypothetical protein